MILADKIINERKKNGWSQEELADMLQVSRQSVSKWEGAQSVPDLQKILKMAEIFGVSTDYLLKDELEPETAVVPAYEALAETEAPLKRVSLEEATEYIEARKKFLPKIGLGVFLCITCPVVLIFLAALEESHLTPLKENAAAAIGLVFLFLQIATALYIFITTGTKLDRFDYLEKENFETEYGVDGMVKAKKAMEEGRKTKALTTGVLLCVLGVLPLVVTGALEAPEFVVCCMVCLLLLLIGVGVYLFVAVCGVHASYDVLLQSGDYTKEAKTTNKRLDVLTRIYWLLILVVYLSISFLTMRWDMTWIIWAVSGVLFALVRTVGEAVVK